MNTLLSKPISVSSLQEIMTILREAPAHQQQPVYFITPKGGVAQAGVRYWLAVEAIAREHFPQHDIVLIGDCGIQVGTALHALRDGFRAVTCECSPEVEAKLRAIAKQNNAVFVRV